MASIQARLKAFTVPTSVAFDTGAASEDNGSIPLARLTPEVLSELCNDFRVSVFAKAHKRDPDRHY